MYAVVPRTDELKKTGIYAFRRVTSAAVPILFALAMLAALPGQAAAATLSFSPSSGSETVGHTFSVNVRINPDSTKVNASDGTVQFDSSMLRLESFSKSNSVFSLWTSDPVISNAAGTLKFSGGTPSAFSSPGTVLTLKFKALKVGTTKVSYSKGSILAADGKGTNVYTGATSATFTIKPAAAAAPSSAPSYQPVVDSGPPPIAPIISSLAFPDPNGWYATSTGDFSWNLPPDATAVRTLLDTSPSTTPNKVLKPMASSTIVTGVKDGTSYFHVQVKNPSGWGDIATRKLQIDTVPPSSFSIALEPGKNGSTPKLAFKAEDALSGIDHYEILIGSTSVATISASDVTDGTYPVPPQGGGKVLVTIQAYDKAGNMTPASSMLDLPKVVSKSAQSETTANKCASSSPWSFDRILNIIFAFIIGGLVAWMRFTKKNREQIQSRLISRIAEVNDRNDRVFSAMREEFEQMVHDLDKRPYLSPQEREFLENVKEVLDISEELIDTSMDDLKKLARAESGDAVAGDEQQ